MLAAIVCRNYTLTVMDSTIPLYCTLKKTVSTVCPLSLRISEMGHDIPARHSDAIELTLLKCLVHGTRLSNMSSFLFFALALTKIDCTPHVNLKGLSSF